MTGVRASLLTSKPTLAAARCVAVLCRPWSVTGCRDGLCGEHLRHWRHAGRPAGLEFEAWRERVGEPLPARRFVDLSGLSEVLVCELLIGIAVAIAGHRRTRIGDLRRVVSLIDRSGVETICELDLTGVRTDGMRLFVKCRARGYAESCAFARLRGA